MGVQFDPKITVRNASTPYVSGLNEEAMCSHCGISGPETGNSAPLRKNSGRFMKV